MQLLNHNLLPLPPLYPVFCCIRPRKDTLESMDDYLRPPLKSSRGLAQEVNCQLLVLLLAKVTQSFEELTMKLEPWAIVEFLSFSELLLRVLIDELTIAVGCDEFRPQLKGLI